jgi:3-deoxy-7-phosphoheptulonate synthase
MILNLKSGISEKEIEQVIEKIKELGFTPHVSKGQTKTIIGVIGDNVITAREIFEAMPQVESVAPISKPYKLCSREFRKENTVVKVSNRRGVAFEVGGKKVVIIAGPCSVESEQRIIEIAKFVKSAGAVGLRGGAFKPRTSPYSFQGLGEQGLKFLAAARKETGLAVVTEIMNIHTIDLLVEYADIIQVGARNMQNFDLLKELGKVKKPVLLKRGFAATLDELLMSAEYVMSQGNYDVILCERGIRTFETATRFTLDLSAVPVLKRLSHLPVVVDPSHGVGVRDFIPPMSLAALAAGADGLIIEVHPEPAKALSDGAQSLLPEQFKKLMDEIRPLAHAVGREV